MSEGPSPRPEQGEPAEDREGDEQQVQDQHAVRCPSDHHLLVLQRPGSDRRAPPAGYGTSLPSKKSTTPVSSEYSAPTTRRPSLWIRPSMISDPCLR